MGLRQYGELRQMAYLDERCKWLDPAARAALDASSQERLGWYLSQGGESETAESAAASSIAQKANLDCSSPQAEALAQGIHYGTWQMRVTWAIRAHALLPSDESHEWMKGKSSVQSHASTLEAVLLTLRDRYQIPDATVQNLSDQARQMLASRCKAGDKKCPTSDQQPAFKTYAEQWLKQAETYAQALATADDKVGLPERAASK